MNNEDSIYEDICKLNIWINRIRKNELFSSLTNNKIY